MSTFLTIFRIRVIMNSLIILICFMGANQVVLKFNQLLFKPDEIDILRLDVPWHHPLAHVTMMLDKEVLGNDTELLKNININIFLFSLIINITFMTLFILILVQLKKLLIAIKGQTFFKPDNIRIIKVLSYLVGIRVVCSFVFYQIIPLFIPTELIIESINFTMIHESVFFNLITAIDYKLLFVSIILYVVSVSFREGYELKEQSDLTI